jgi:subtilisin family serine protease
MCGVVCSFSWLRLLVGVVVLAVSLVCAGVSWGGNGPGVASEGAGASAISSDPATDGYSMYNLTAQMGAQAWWDAGYTGQGVDVALIDTGVSPVEGLNTPGKVVYGPDLSLESQSPNLRNLDTNGHGTFMAGLIAGHDSTLTAPYSSAPASAYRGIAPDARIISLKVATADGGVDVTQVIAAIDWVVQNAHAPGFNIRVINLSYGTNSTQAYTVDPLAYAIEQAWKHGIVVVTAAGNTGYQRGNGAPGLSDPAYDPYDIGVGGYNTMGTSSFHDDQIGWYSASSAGCGNCKNPDLVAPGSHIQGLRVPGSYIDVNDPQGRIDSRYFRGSGTSEATAITSGVIALILQKYPDLTPDGVKRFLTDNGQKVPGADSQAQGGGEIDLSTLAKKNPQANYVQKFDNSTGRGSIELSRGSDHISRNGVELTGNEDIFGNPFDPTALATAEAAGSSWSGGMWNGSNWASSSWSSSSWSSSSWSGSSWSSSSWSSSSWSGSSWSGAVWASAGWG